MGNSESLTHPFNVIVYEIKNFLNIGIYAITEYPYHDQKHNHPRIAEEGDRAANPIPMYFDNEPPSVYGQEGEYDWMTNLLNAWLFVFYAFWGWIWFNVNAFMGDFETYWYFLLTIFYLLPLRI